MSSPSVEPRLSLCMIVKNEAQWLARCLESVKGVADEMVIVDTGSEDATPAIAHSHGAIVLQHRWEDDFSAARNVALEKASGDWILHLDADEELETKSRAQLRGLIAATDAEGVQLRVRNLQPEGELQRYDDIFITRLFRNRPAYRYEQSIHEQIRPSIVRQGGRVDEADLTILHYGYAQRTAQGQGSRASRNLQLLRAALAASPDDPYLQYQLGVTYKAMGQGDLAYSALRKLLELDYQTLSSHTIGQLFMKLSQLALKADNLREAIDYAGRSLAIDPGNLISLYVMALAHMFQGHLPKAYDCFSQIRKANDGSVTNLQELDAVLAYCREQLGQAAP